MSESRVIRVAIVHHETRWANPQYEHVYSKDTPAEFDDMVSWHDLYLYTAVVIYEGLLTCTSCFRHEAACEQAKTALFARTSVHSTVFDFAAPPPPPSATYEYTAHLSVTAQGKNMPRSRSVEGQRLGASGLQRSSHCTRGAIYGSVTLALPLKRWRLESELGPEPVVLHVKHKNTCEHSSSSAAHQPGRPLSLSGTRASSY